MNREEALFEAALGKSSHAERAAFLDEACQGDAAVRARLEALLKGHFDAAFLPDSVPAEARSGVEIAPVTEKPGDRMGRYKLLEKIGEGGWGVVYMAEQEEPVRRRVALKIIKVGMDTRDFIARFEAERQALALMDHPNIARVFDGGATDTGRPFFVMELVRGIKLTEYCDQNQLAVPDRLHLFTQVCQAVQHAHQKGVIHRDLKPSNILVTVNDGVPVPKVIDFGIAKATGPKLTDKTLFTGFNAMIGTPAYMSPEQAEMTSLDIDTRSDIYALGVVLYELLTGKTPFETKELLQAGFDEMRRTIREKEPARPSTRLRSMQDSERTTTAKRRRTEGPKLINVLSGDLDWIVMKCLEKDRSRRYDSATSLAQDVHRHLNNEPVLARPPGTLYRLQKTFRRNRLAVTASAAVVVALVAGLGVSSWSLLKERKARARAEAAETSQARLRQTAEDNEKMAHTEALMSRQVAQFLEEMLQGVGPKVALGRDTTLLREILDATSQRLATSLKDQPDVEAQLRNTLGTVYMDLSEFPTAESMFREALLKIRQVHEEHVNVAEILNNLARALAKQSKLTEAESLHRQALEMKRKLLGNDHERVATSLENLAELLQKLGKWEEADSLHGEAMAIVEKRHGRDHLTMASILHNLSSLRKNQGRRAEAESLQREALAIQRRHLSDEHPTVANSIATLASLLARRGRLTEAEDLHREALKIRKKVLPAEHADLATSLNNLGFVLQHTDKLEESEALHREALAMRQKLLPPVHSSIAASLDDLASVLHKRGQLSQAEELYGQALVMRRKLYREDHDDIAESAFRLGDVLLQQRRPAEAERYYREAAVIREKQQGEQTGVANLWSRVAEALKAQKRLADAEQAYLRALGILRKAYPDGHEDTAGTLHNLNSLLSGQGRLEEAEKYGSEALTLAEKFLKANDPRLDTVRYKLAVVLERRDKLQEARTLLLKTLEVRAEFKLDKTQTPLIQSALGDVLRRLKDFPEAARLLEDACREIARREAKRSMPDNVAFLTENFQRLVQLYDAWEAAEPDTGKAAKAAEWKRKLAELPQAPAAASKPAAQP